MRPPKKTSARDKDRSELGLGNHICLIGADHLHGEDETKTEERLVDWLSLPPPQASQIRCALRSQGERYMPASLICDFIGSV